MLTSFRARERQHGFGASIERAGHKFDFRPALDRAWDSAFNAQRFNPQAVWQLISTVTLSEHYGPSKYADKSGDTYNWYQKVIRKFDGIDTPSAADFILEGRNVILNAYQNSKICDEQRQVLADYYNELVTSESFKSGWEYLYRNVFINESRQSNPRVISSLVGNLRNRSYGVAGEFPMVHDGEHLFVTEYKNFLRFLQEDVNHTIDPQAKGQLIKQVQDSVLPAIRMEMNPRLDDVLTDIYTSSVDSLSEGYGACQANSITREYNIPKANSTFETQQADLLRNIEITLKQLEDLLVDPGVGIGGKRPELAEKAIKLFDETVTAISQRHALVQGVFFEAASEKILKILAKTKDPVVQQMYTDLVREKLKDGQKFMAHQKLADTEGKKAGEFINLLLDRIDDQIYGDGGQRQLTDVFIEQIDTFLEEVGDQRTKEQAPVYEAIVSRVKDRIRREGDTKKSIELAKFYDKAIAKLGDQYVESQKEYMFDVPADLEQTKQFKEGVEANITAAMDTLDIEGEVPSEVIEFVTQQTRESFIEAPIRKVWNDYLDDLVNSASGEGGSVVSLSDKVKKVFKMIKGKVKDLSADKQYLFYKVGKEQLLIRLKAIHGENVNHQVVVDEFKALITDNEFEQGKLFEKQKIMAKSEKAARIDKNASRYGYYHEIWVDYLNNLYHPALAQGSYMDISKELKADFNRLVENMATAEFEHTGTFLRAGYKAMIEKLKDIAGNDKTALDARQRIVFDAFALLSYSEIALKMEFKETDLDGMQGAKSVKTLGQIQIDFINEVTADHDVLSNFFAYIETKAKEGTFKNDKEERLCITMLYINRDKKRMRIAGNKVTFDGIGEFDLGFAPDWETLQEYHEGVTASLESSVKAIEDGQLNAYLEVLAAIGDISPYTLIRLASRTEIGRLLKNNRKFGRDDKAGPERARLIAKIKEDQNLSASEKFYLIYAATGKMDYDLEAGRQLRKDDLVNEIISGAVKSRDKKDLLALLLTYRDDVCQVSTIPGLQAIMGEQWNQGEEMLSLRKSIFEKYFTTAVARIQSKKYNEGGQHSKIAATELLALSMMLEQTKGEDEAMKDGSFVRIFSDLMYDIITQEGNGKYHKDVVDMAWKVLNYSIPYWSTERVRTFVNLFATKVKLNNDVWLENNNWRKFIKALAVVDGGILSTEDEAKTGDIRPEIAKIVIDATLEILEIYDVIGGRSSVRSPIDILTNEDSKWPSGYKPPKEDNFIEQTIGMVSFIGVEEKDEDMKEGQVATKHKTRLKNALEELARRDNLRYAWKLDMMPEHPATTFIETSETMIKQMREAVQGVETKFADLLSGAVQRSRSFIEVDEEGKVVNMADKPALVTKIEQEGVETLNTLIRKVKLEAKTRQAKAHAGKVAAGLEGLNGEEFVDIFLEKVEGYSGDDKEFKTKVLTALQKFSEARGGSSEFANASDDASRFAVNVEKAAGFGSWAAMLSKASGMAGLQGILEAYLQHDKAFGANLIKTLLDSSGLPTTVVEAEKIRQVILKGMNQVLTDENVRQEAIMGMRRAEEQSYGADLLLIEALRNKYVSRETGIGGKVVDLEADTIEKEIEQLKREIITRHTARESIITEYEGALPEAAQKLAQMQRGYSAAAVNEADAFYKWLNRVSGPKGPMVDRSRKYAAAVGSAHQMTFDLRNMDVVQLDLTKLAPTPGQILQTMGLKEAYSQYIPTSWNASLPTAA